MSSDETRDIAICFTQGHGEKLVIEQVQHEGLVDMLFRSGYKLGKIETWVSWQKLCDYQVLVIGVPQEDKFEEIEIKAIDEFVKGGGSLFLLSDEGGDNMARSNINEIAGLFGLEFQPVILLDEKNYSDKAEYVVINKFERHFITRDVSSIVFASGCSIKIVDKKQSLVLARAGPDAMMRRYEEGEWSDAESASGEPIMVVKRHGEGKVVAIGNFSIITSISNTYGLYAADNFTLIGNLFAWLVNKKLGDKDKEDLVYMNISLDTDLYYWIERELKNKKRFKNVNQLINFALQAIKRSFDNLDKSEGDEEKP